MHRRLVHWVSLLGSVLITVTLVGCGSSSSHNNVATRSAAITTQPNTAATGSGMKVNVVAREFSFTLNSSSVSTGPVTFVVKNTGVMQHDFAIRGNGVEQKTAELQPGATGSFTVDLQPGTYRYVCTVPGHESLGMNGSFTVH